MKKWIYLILIVVLVSMPFGLLYLMNNGNPIDRFIANRYIPGYLEKQGISANQLIDSHYVEPKHSINKDFYHGHYMVKFKNEPDMTYYYGVLKKGKEVKQFCERNWSYSTMKPIDYYEKKNKSKHLEKDCVNSLDNK